VQGREKHWHTQAITKITGDIATMKYHNGIQYDLNDIVDESRAQGWHKLLFNDVIAEISNLPQRAATEAALYKEHMVLTSKRANAHFGHVMATSFLRPGSTRDGYTRNIYAHSGINARTRLHKYIYDMIKGGVRIIKTPITISVQLREITQPHILLFPPQILQVMQSYRLGYNILIEELMYGDDRCYLALLPSDDMISAAVTLWTSIPSTPI